MESYTRSAATELGPYGTTVKVISPSAVQTGWIPPAMEKEIAASYPLQRISEPEDVAQAAIFLHQIRPGK